MRAEPTSLAELGLLPDTAGQWPLATLLDHTHARPAHDALKRLIATPLDTIADIEARQRLLPALATLSPQVRWSELHGLAVQVGRYLASNYVLLPTSAVERAVFALRNRDIVAELTGQLRRVDELLRQCALLQPRLATLPNDTAFARIVFAFTNAVHDPRVATLHAAVDRNNTNALAGLDGMVRGTITDGSWSLHAETSAIPLRDVLRALIDAIWQLDAFCSLGTASESFGGITPQLAPRGAAEVSFEGLRHPLLPQGIANDVALSTQERVLFLTGPNMAGKSTLLRAFGVAIYFAHLGMNVTADSTMVPLFDTLMVSITVRDNLQRGESLYLAEIRRVHTIVEAVARGESVAAIFDEVFRGTNIADATQATTLLVQGLANAPYGTFVIASHLADVAHNSTTNRGVSCWYMQVDIAGPTPLFTHRVQRGVSDVHLGMRLLDAEGVGPTLRRMAGLQ
ncbi:MAG: hypothetical protein HEQ38_13700 [Gemmatimonas sp.]|nr:hypothetical protein [Gemmatimonas sp.]